MIKDTLRITIVQPELQWENPQANLYHLKQLLERDAPTTDLIMLPEMFPTGFSMKAEELAELPDGTSVKWMKRMAKEYDAVVCGSVITRDASLDGSDRFYNRLHWVRPNGEVDTYDKRHLFTFAKEDEHYDGGNERLIVELEGWRICPLICYDLRFPVWSRNADLNGAAVDHVYDLLLYVANWPKARNRAWINLLEARAHENQAYVAGVNRIGTDGNDIEYSGDSAIYSPKGEKLEGIDAGQEGVKTVEIAYEDLRQFREKFTAWNDKDRFSLKS